MTYYLAFCTITGSLLNGASTAIEARADAITTLDGLSDFVEVIELPLKTARFAMRQFMSVGRARRLGTVVYRGNGYPDLPAIDA